MRVDVRGNSHLASTLRRAAARRGFNTTSPPHPDLYISAQDVLDHGELGDARSWFDGALDLLRGAPSWTALVLASQVPPGTTRAWAGADAHRVFYQVDTIIMRSALARAYAPEQIIVGCEDPSRPLPLAYQEYLLAHDCPVRQMSYESAELAKCAINYVLAAQIAAARDLAVAVAACGADYADVEAALRGDARIGLHAYMRPGAPNQHLMRDVETIAKRVGVR